MTTPLIQFRKQYPEGALTATLVSINEGQYIVRAAISQNGQELATGLAASVDVQIAEDKARDRALALLGFGNDNTQLTAAEISKAEISKTAILTKAPEVESTSPPDVQPLDENAAVEAPLTDDSLPPDVDASDIDLPADEADLAPPIDAVPEEALPPADARTSAATIALENFNTGAAPVDLSDVIAQTDVELARLGWTNVQGREYLETTYGKRSRQHLTDEELMSFLLYLEEQPG